MEGTLKLLFFGTFFINVEVSQRADTANYIHDFVFVTNETITWSEAQKLCRAKYDDLATIANEEDLSKITGMPESLNRNVWIGLYRDYKRWKWSDQQLNEELGEFRLWGTGQPDNVGAVEFCVSMTAEGYWNDKTCDDETMPFICFNERDEYVLVTEVKTWLKAQSYCRMNYKDLISVRSTDDRDKVVQKLQTDGSVQEAWIGLSRQGWTWSDGSGVSITKWMIKQPNNYGGSQQCVYMHNGKWNDYYCDSRFHVLCQKVIPRKKRFVVKVKISSDVNLNLPAERDSLLQQFQSQLEKQGVTHVKISWRADNNEPVFQCQKDKEDASKLTGC